MLPEVTMTAPDAAEAAAQRIDELLAELRSARPARRRRGRGADLLPGAAVRRRAGPDRGHARPGRVADLCADPLVESLLLVHDLHPVAADARIRRALERAGRPPGDVDHLAVDEAGVVRLRLAAGGRGCSSSRRALVGEIEAVVRRAAPEATDVDVEFPVAPPPLLQVSLRPGLGRPAPVPAEAAP